MTAALAFSTWSYVNQDAAIDYAAPVSQSVDYIIMMNSNTLSLLSGTYVQNSNNVDDILITLALNKDCLNNADSVSDVAGLSHGVFSLNTTLGEELLEIMAIKIFGNTKTRAAIKNDTAFLSYDLRNSLSDSINIAISADKHHIFNQYVLSNQYKNQDLNDVNNGPVPFNFTGLALNVPFYLKGTLNGSDNNIITAYNGPVNSIGASAAHIVNGEYNIPLMLQFTG